jgi:hypothetical protein
MTGSAGRLSNLSANGPLPIECESSVRESFCVYLPFFELSFVTTPLSHSFLQRNALCATIVPHNLET